MNCCKLGLLVFGAHLNYAVANVAAGTQIYQHS